jgi:hypothetical protein
VVAACGLSISTANCLTPATASVAFGVKLKLVAVGDLNSPGLSSRPSSGPPKLFPLARRAGPTLYSGVQDEKVVLREDGARNRA